MKAMILCAGLGTRLRPWTERHPKALVPVGGVPMLKRVADRLMDQGFDALTVNIHHFADQIIDFIDKEASLSGRVNVSDETEMLLDTGGGILKAAPFLGSDPMPFLVHNVDILSNADLKSLMEKHGKLQGHVTLLVSDRNSDRKLVLDKRMKLKGWLNRKSGERRPSSLILDDDDRMLSFSGIYVMNPDVFQIMKSHGFSGAFPIMDFFLAEIPELCVYGVEVSDLQLIDIGKPDTLDRANLMIQ